MPTIALTLSFVDAIDEASGLDALKLILYEKEGRVRLRDLAGEGERPGRVVIACGPEGGFTEDEVQAARERAFVPVSLGGRVLRCETAALASLAIIQYVWGDL